MSHSIGSNSVPVTVSDFNKNCFEMTANEVTQKRFSVDKVETNNNNVSNGSETRRAQLSVDHYMTREAPPRVDHYRNVLSIHGRVSRPTLEELHVGQSPETYLKVSLRIIF
jgi:hypothetical protein